MAALHESPRLPYRDRTDAGRALARDLKEYADRGDTVIAAIPRGGVVVGVEVANLLCLPLTVFLLRKLGMPGQEELSLGAIASGGSKIINADLVRSLRVPQDVLDSVAFRESQELLRRERLYARGRPPVDLRDKIVILVDDGIATGAGARLAIQAVRRQGARKVILAVPVGPRNTMENLRQEADEVVCPAEPANFHAVGEWYEDFRQVSDCEVCQLLDSLSEKTPRLQSA
jgi:putative phosphoribosyl transferase